MQNSEQHALKHLQERIDGLIRKYKGKKVIFYGAGEFFKALKNKFNLEQFDIIGVSDIKFSQQKIEEYEGYKAIKPTEIGGYKPDVVFISMLHNDIAINFFEQELFQVTGRFEYEKLIEHDYTDFKKNLVKLDVGNKVEEINNANNAVLEKLKSKLENKDEKLKIVFLVSEAAKWNCQSLYDELKREPRLEANITVDKNEIVELNRQKNIERFRKNYNFFRSIDPKASKLYDEKKDESLPIETLDADIIFYQQPWGMIDYPKRVLGRALSVYLPYSFLLTANYNMHYHVPSFHYYLWRYFTQSELHKEIHLSFDPKAENKLFVSGYPKFDVYFDNHIKNPENIWKKNMEKHKEIKRVIYAPHWSFSEKNNLRFGTFSWNYKYFLELAKNNSNIQWIYKPHPILGDKVIEQKLISKKEYEDYVAEWDSLPNARVYNSGNYFDIFKTSDALITDCCSFLGEYLPSVKPVIHLLREGSIGYNEVGQNVVKPYYKASNIQEVDDLIKRVVINADDYLYEKRTEALKYVLPNKEKASVLIKNHLKEVFSI